MKQKPPKTLTPDECERLLTALLVSNGSKLKKRRGYRNYLAGCLMLDAGLRVGETCGLWISDLVITSEPVTRLVVPARIAKGHRERCVPVTERIRSAIRGCYKHFWYDPESHALRPAIPGERMTVSMHIVQMERIIKSAAEISIHRDVHPHMLRHTYATRLMRKTNTRVVQQLLGHKDLSSTQIYLHPNQEDLDSAVRAIET